MIIAHMHNLFFNPLLLLRFLLAGILLVLAVVLEYSSFRSLAPTWWVVPKWPCAIVWPHSMPGRPIGLLPR
jgi:hypothetical protein